MPQMQVRPSKQLATGVSPALFTSDAIGRLNKLTNGGFELWQRGSGPYTANGAWGPDRWQLSVQGADTLSVSKDTANVDIGSSACVAATYAIGAGGGSSAVFQTLKVIDFSQLAGRTVSLSMRVRTATANAVRAAIVSDAGAVASQSGYHTGNGQYQTLTCTFTLPLAATYVQVMLYFYASCTAYMDNASLVTAAYPEDYFPLHPADELLRCQRYYEVQGGVNTGGPPCSFGYGAAANASGYAPSFAAVKPIVPTMTKVGSWAVNNCAQPAFRGISKSGYEIDAVVTALGSYYWAPNDATGLAVAEANP